MSTGAVDPSSDLSSDKALLAANVCVWEWIPGSEVLSIKARGTSVLPDIEGDWRLDDLQPMLDGLSGPALKSAFGADLKDTRISFTLGLGDGRDLKLIGARTPDGRAHGLIFDSSPVNEIVADQTSKLEAVFQPIIRISDGAVAGFEALARWRNDDGDLIGASEFTRGSNPLAAAGLALNMLTQSGEALADWQDEYPALKLFMQVNLTGADLFRPEVLEKVADLVASGRIAPNSLRIELTEQMALRDFEAGIAAAAALKASGVTLVLDDFGSGYSSLAWLASVPAEGIKLDPQLTQLAGTPRADTILSSIVRLARSLGMSVTAEGIEDFDRVQFLKGIGCNYVQGFAYARPMDRPAAKRFLKAQTRFEELKG